MSSRLQARYLVLTLVAIHALWPDLPCGSDFGDSYLTWACHRDEYPAFSLDLFSRVTSFLPDDSRLAAARPDAPSGGG